MERIIEQRHILGLPAKAIQWGAVGDVGLVAEKITTTDTTSIGGTLLQRISSCLEELDTLIASEKPIVSSMVVAEKRTMVSQANAFDAIMNVMSIQDTKSLSMEATLADLGMDSMTSIEIQQILQREHDLAISVQDLRTMKLHELMNIGQDKKDEKNVARVKRTGLSMITRDIGDDTASNENIVKIQSASEEGVKILIIPGIMR